MTTPHLHSDDYLRIGELSRRTGVSVDLLRAWERRYGVLRPVRSPGGFRLYGVDDEERVRRMREQIERGVAPAEAAMLVRQTGVAAVAPPPPPRVHATTDPVADLRDALEGFDAESANAALDRLVTAFNLETLLSHVVLPYLREVGERWHAGEISIGQEHFASSLLRARLLHLGQAWDAGSGPRAVLACPPGEQHDMGLIALGLALRALGWRITFLGADAPVATAEEVAATVGADVVVVAGTGRQLGDAAHDLRALAARHTLALAGPAAEDARLAGVAALTLAEDPVRAAHRLDRARKAGEIHPALRDAG